LDRAQAVSLEGRHICSAAAARRNRFWADDAYMGIPALAELGRMTGDRAYFEMR